MKNLPTQTNKNEGIFLYLLLLTGFFILLEISFFILCNQMYLSDYTFMSDHLDLPLMILPGIVYFLLAQLLVHFSYCIVIWMMTCAIAKLFNLSSNKKLILGVSIWIGGIAAVLAANQYFFPNSKFTELSAMLLSDQAAKIVFMISVFFMSILMCLTILANNHLKLLLIGLAIPISYPYLNEKTIVSIDAATQEKPNIIIVGVDSLRPDFLSFFGSEKITPFFDSFLEQATVFSEAITPLARTFPSWTGILSGEYPRQIGIRTNLAQQNQINLTHTLPSILRRQGYNTIYATDETRFSNIDKNYGFDQVITPPMGLNDFLLGTFNDFPLSNLLLNTPIGKWIFPYSYANRPVYFSYEPDSFLHLIKPHIIKNRSKPLFLAIHFCLPHHPYLWASLSGRVYEPLARYEMSVNRVDQQLQDFFMMLKQANLLEHAVVILLSDHGEALELPGDRITEGESFLSKTGKSAVPVFYPPSLDKESVNQSVGHGTDVLSLPQYHSLLAFRLYGVGKKQHRGAIPGVVSLLSIKPTVLDLIGSREPTDINRVSTSLVLTITGKNKSITQHGHIFLESDFTPQAIRTVYPETRDVVLEGIKLFRIDPKTTRLIVRDNMGKMIIKSKQYADIHGNWMLALYPQNNHYRMPILINLVSGKWTNDLHTDFAQNSPAKEMLAALQTFYGDEIE